MSPSASRLPLPLLALLAAALVALVPIAGRALPPPKINDAAITGETYPATLREFGFFLDSAGRDPAPGVVPYRLNSPLFSDYAEKFRFTYVPAGMQVEIGDNGRLLFPVGSALIKSFGYNYEGKGVRLLETRVLLHRAEGWVAIPYVWNPEQTEAVLKRAGMRQEISIFTPMGEAKTFSYAVPNQNQCKGCHVLDGAIQPIGPKLRNLDDGSRIADWQARGWLPADLPTFETMPSYDDIEAPLDARARAYLDVNCGHCHNRRAPASNSGLFLTWEEQPGVAIGLYKRPVAAGRGSGDLDFAIWPGHPEGSYLPYRMNSTDPGIAMPELGRALIHREGVDLIREWIAAMPEGEQAGAAN